MAITMAQALNTALHDAMAEDDRVVMFGEDVGTLGGVFRITDKLQERFGDKRCFDTPLAESAIVGSAVGMALYGYKPVVEMQFDGFTYPAFEQIVSHVAKMRNRSRGKVTLPITIRIPFGGGIGAVEHHSESPENFFAHVAGLKVVTPGTPSDGYSLLRESITAPDPVIFFEPKRRYWLKEDADLPTQTEPIGRAVVRREGTTATLFAYGPMVKTCVEAASAAEDEGWDLEVVDLRSLNPFDAATVVDSVRKTGHAVVVHEAQVFSGFGAELAAQVAERAFYHLEAPVLRVGGFDIPYPAAKLEEFFLPDVDRILDAVERSLAF
ncbi:MAG: alpha-ketoacid dehydrogenase subunit beta [Nitriliruptorales bacterium]|nr:alpha-ketoacid dehydrogenase subunit beta [Nitriliruptorales bacterium]